ncbi:HAD family hydrolase [Dubosiella newyorkensis]|uniref:HAD family hydrolase n=1 Tax=Dubosiella newyorkensis TaxID=1862672 RepID=UPI00248B9729|nr:HAD family hydrolase [Dubosiella newyorkensis]
MKHKIVFFDMDGTLYQTENDVIQDSTIAAIQNLKEAGYIVAAATGRPLNQMKLILQRLDFNYYVLINGGYILDHDFNMISASPIKHDTLESLVKLAQDQEYGLMLHFGDATYIYNNFYPMYDFSKYCNVLDSLFYDPTQSFHKRHDAYNAVILTKNVQPLQDFMEDHEDLRSDLINVKTNGFCYDIFNVENDKAHGIEMILEREGLTWDDVIAFGDSTNDTKMLEKADIGVAMGSASDYVKSFANFSTTDIQNHGIYNALKKIMADED